MVILVSLTRSCYGLGEACTADDSSNCTEIDLGFSGCTNGNAANECADDNTECTTGVCKCVSTHYDNNGDTSGGECDKKKKLGEACSTNQDCTSSDSYSECSGSKCQCQSFYYDDNGDTAEGTCASKVNLEGTCTAATSGSDDPCNTAFAVCTRSESSYTCKCQGGYYKSGGNTCSKELPLDSPCLQPDACATAHSVCLQNKCQCSDNYYNTNDAIQYRKTCKSKHNLNVNCDDGANPNQCKDDKAVCTYSNTVKLCRCIAGYHEKKGVCIASKKKDTSIQNRLDI
ncbi:hypothetical protein MAR_033737 [Mya arenaria]|uniref:EB domain-containing protein n=1 Tax=Mya arenaria TaxID=6604 RepID=A0ABY7G9V8_MYAAR|nr:hypothetical protein MAR_033737 [Mya arenaria]